VLPPRVQAKHALTRPRAGYVELIVFDYSRGQLILEPNAHFAVAALEPDSPASAAGIREGGVLVAVERGFRFTTRRGA